jgi:hypothetical protein
MKHPHTNFHARVGTVRIPQKSCWDMLRQTCVFASGGICRSRSAFWCVRVTKHRCTIFQARVEPVWIAQKRAGTRYTEHVFLHLAGSVVHVLHSGASRTRNVKALIFMLGWDRYGFDKKHFTTRYAKLVVLHPGCETSTYYFSCSGGTSMDHTIACWNTLRRTCVFASGGICGSRSAFQCIWVTKHHRSIFHARVGPVRISQKVLRNTLSRTCVFASCGICGSHSAFWCV